MGICPLCNGFEKIDSICPSCGTLLVDNGRIMDYYDDYSPYMPIDLLKLEDGYKSDFQKEQCPHYFSCQGCNFQTVMLIEE